MFTEMFVELKKCILTPPLTANLVVKHTVTSFFYIGSEQIYYRISSHLFHCLKYSHLFRTRALIIKTSE